ncbi:UNC-50 [Cokeromyces recurvatus]|uniref:UNC-50 n=1 Tax=Cokeromyces recurvatus TaxID=90255 RepID=UPI00221EBDB7|nr:UNC-50 [Cokeromyces recurvatus]KAI7907917.1 UNC-50 [Cokeromyces recurvatus]
MASILPTTHSSNFGSSHSSSFYYNENNGRYRRNTNILKRLFRFPHMDFEFALWQMGYLLIAPRRVYRNIYYHKQTKNQWSRDDPAFIVLLALFLTLSGIIWGFTYNYSVLDIMKTSFFMVFIDLLLVGFTISTVTWFITNKFLIQNINSYAVAQKVEWAYAFDIHCNSFVPVYMILYIIQLFFLPLILKENWISMFIGNFMYCAALIWYTVGTFLGFNALPFLVHTELFLYPIALFIALFVASLFGFNIPQYTLGHYFSNN